MNQEDHKRDDRAIGVNDAEIIFVTGPGDTTIRPMRPGIPLDYWPRPVLKLPEKPVTGGLPLQTSPLTSEPTWNASPMNAIVIADEVRIPAWVKDLESFRRWATSADCPELGWFSYLGGEFWVDLSMEELIFHNGIKGEVAIVLGTLARAIQLGRYFHDRTRVSNPAVDLSSEPDGLFASWETLRQGRLKMVPGAEGDIVELEGTPDMVLEVVSKSSVRKDTVTLRDLYWRAGIPEYWLVDPRRDPLTFQILRPGAQGYEPASAADGWLPSAVFRRSVRLTRTNDPLGQPLFTLEVRE